MIEQVTTAFENKDYRTAAKLLKQLSKESPDNPWVQFYVARLHEVSGKREEAQQVYRQLLRDVTNTKIISQSRQGLQRLQQIEQEERQHKIAQATAEPQNTEPGVLILEPIPTELKQQAASKFGQIMQIDSYTARLLLPSRGWRLYRSGAVGELRFFGQQLQNAGIPCFWANLAAIENITVFQVDYIEATTPSATVICRNSANQLGSLCFEWSEVKQRVIGNLPIFEEVVDRDVRGQLVRKTKTQDHIQFYDLHLPDRNYILRLQSNGYNFRQGIQFTETELQNTVTINWNCLLSFLYEQLSKIKVVSDFTFFAETALDQTEVLNRIESHIHLFRKENSYWDSAFHLYSGLGFTKLAKNFN